MNAAMSRIWLLWRITAAVAILTGILAGPPATARDQQDVPLDLAALILHPDDLDWLLDEPDYPVDHANPYGQHSSTSFTTIDEAVRHPTYAEGRGGLTLNLMGEREAADMLENAGWVRSQSALAFLPEPGRDGYWSLGIAVTIEEFEDVEGAEKALAWFDDTGLLEELTYSERATAIDPALEIDEANTRGWELNTYQYAEEGTDDEGDNFATLWAQVDTMVVSVTLMHTFAYPEPDTNLLAPLVELQLKRLELAEYLYQPGLGNCAPEFQDVRSADTRAEYQTLNGTTFPLASESFEELEVAQAQNDELGVVDSYVINQSIEDTAVGVYDGTMWYRGQVRNLASEEAAEDYVAGYKEYLKATYPDVEQLGDHPDLGNSAALFNYAANDGPATIILVQVDDQVFSIRLGSITDHQPEAAVELAEAHLDRMDGDCDTQLELPDALLDANVPASHHA